MDLRTSLRLILAAVLWAATSAPAANLSAADLLLIANKNNADSVELARYYAQQRGVPESRLLLVDMPFRERCSLAEYEDRLAKPVRAFLSTDAGRGVRCLVLFYGIPFHVEANQSTPAERDEVAMLRRLLAAMDAKLLPVADAVEAIAQELGIEPTKTDARGAPGVRVRLAGVMPKIEARLRSEPPDKRQAVVEKLNAIQKQLAQIAEEAIAEARRRPADGAPKPSTQPTTPEAEQRDQQRQKAARQHGAFALYLLTEQQIIQISAQETDAAVDSELALVQRPGYSRFKWQPNPLVGNLSTGPKTALMVARIDGATPQIARRIIDDAIATEKTGLDGRIAFDSRGIPPNRDGYAWYDQDIRDAANWVKKYTKLPVVHDDRAALINPHAVQDAAFYCGWYSLRQYIPSCDFVRGAVAYHVASLEMVSLRGKNEKGWVTNLLKNNVCATLGAVSEPYLHAFPRPTAFVPLLLSGKLTLAEVYWATIPMTSWKIALIGDPLYRPFAARPAVAVGDLSQAHQKLIQKIEATDPVGR